jgi:hypothetical protein
LLGVRQENPLRTCAVREIDESQNCPAGWHLYIRYCYFAFWYSGLTFQPVHLGCALQSLSMARKLRVGILFGGRSGEHEVSLLSAASILKAIDRRKFEVVPIGITKEGRWLAASDAHSLLNGASASTARQLRAGDPEVTPAARLLHEGIPTLFAPEPENPPLVRTKKSRTAVESGRAPAFADSSAANRLT